MKHLSFALPLSLNSSFPLSSKFFFALCMGLLAPLGFAPFHLPGLTILSLAAFFSLIQSVERKQSVYLAFIYGLGFFGLGVSWVVVSIHDYGQLNYLLSGLITSLFIIYLALFPAAVAYLFKTLAVERSRGLNAILFSVLWCLSEVLRAHFITGFPWLLIGTTLIDTPIKYLTPLIGVYGLSLWCAFLSAFLSFTLSEKSNKRSLYVCFFILLIIAPSCCRNMQWTQIQEKPITIGAIQANLSMRDKWDESLFWNLLRHYEKAIHQLLGNQLIILPESAIPLPANYLDKYLHQLSKKATQVNSAVMLGIPQANNNEETNYYNAIMTLGKGSGQKLKYHLVPFGEYIPKPFVTISRWLQLPDPNFIAGPLHQPLIQVANHPIASLICYEIAYPNLLRVQMPQAQWIVSISDNGWFGHSLASYQQLQMAQVLSLLTGRYQIVVNNDGLSSVISEKGELIDSLPAFSAGILRGTIFPALGSTPWIRWGEYPAFIFCAFFLVYRGIRQHLLKH